MCLGCRLVARAAIAEIVAVENAGFLEQANGAVHGRDRDTGIDLRRALIDLLDIGVVVRLGQHAGDDSALLSNAQALLVAEGFQIDLARHVSFPC